MMDDECSICHSLQEARNHLKRIGDYILLTCPNKEKKDFGLYLKGDRGIAGTMKMIANLQKYHQRYHAKCDEDPLLDDDFGLDSSKPKPRRWRPPKRNNG